MATLKRPALPLSEVLFWEAMRKKWPSGQIRWMNWLDDSPTVAEIQNALSEFRAGRSGSGGSGGGVGDNFPLPAFKVGVSVDPLWPNPGKYDVETMNTIREFAAANGILIPNGIMTKELYEAMGIPCTELYGLNGIPQPPLVKSKKVGYIVGALLGSAAIYYLFMRRNK